MRREVGIRVGSRATTRWIGGVAALAAAAVLLACQGKREESTGAGSRPPAASAAPQTGGTPADSAPAPAASPPEATIEVGEAVRISSTQLAVPLAFYAADSRDVGRVHAELAVPDGPYKFAKAEPSEKRRWKISAKQNGKAIELDVSGGDRAITDGDIGRLVFNLPEGGVPDRVPLTVNHVHTQPPQAESAAPKSSGELPATPDSSAPSPGCFFFTH
jgi:hypothetical protein